MKKLRGIVAVLCLLAACLCWGLASAENDVLYVANPKPEDRLHLRKEANTSSGSLGKYYNGVQVEALEFRKDGWVRVKLDDTMGYMRSEYLRRRSCGQRHAAGRNFGQWREAVEPNE